MSVLLLLVVVGLVLLNGFFVAAEFALVRVRREKIEREAADGDAAATRALAQIDQIDAYLAACQVGITVASLGLGWVGEPTFANLFEPALGGALGHGVAIVVSAILAFSIITFAHITFGEQVPKMVAVTRSTGTVKWIGLPLQLFKIAFWPVITVLQRSANGIARLVGVRLDQDLQDGTTSEDLKFLISRGAVAGHLDKGEAGMLSGVFHMHEQQARQVMTPIPAVVTADVNESVEAALRRCVASGHTRLLVIEEDNPDQIRGIVHINALSRLLISAGSEASLEPLVRPVPIVPESRPLDDLLADLQRERSSMAVAVNEYGRTVGIVTVEDIVEEIVGEIEDETDQARASLRRLANGDWFVRGHVSIDDLINAGIELPVDSDAYTSIGGFVFDELGRLPKRGDVIGANGYSIRVESVRENRVEAVRIRKKEQQPTG